MRIQFSSKQTPVSAYSVWVTVFLSRGKKEDCSRPGILHNLLKEKIYTNKNISCEMQIRTEWGGFGDDLWL